VFLIGLFIGYKCWSKSRGYSLENEMRDDIYRKRGEEAVMKRARETMKTLRVFIYDSDILFEKIYITLKSKLCVHGEYIMTTLPSPHFSSTDILSRLESFCQYFRFY
jgi:hypothetical protein